MYMKLLFYHFPLLAMHCMSIYSLEKDLLVHITCCYSAFCVLGDNCSSEIQAKEFSPSFIPISCELQFSTFVNGLSISDLFQVSATFNSKKGTL